jgi:mRNA deadenylase 3'-5' endonuclease subunit Ccr4
MDIMAIHSSVVKDFVFQLVDGQDFIFSGDFNIKPKDACYKALIEKGYVDCNFPNSTTYDISYRPNTEQLMNSAYREKNGTELVYTNFFHKSYLPLFCDTLDYIFFNGRLTVEKLLNLPDHPTGKSYADETHSLDYLTISEPFRLKRFVD